MSRASLRLRSTGGDVVAGDRWAGGADDADRAVLRRCHAPVLDIGCGPARHVLALAEDGVPVLGIDLTPDVVAWARRRGALVIERCVFDRVPGAGRWRTVLLLDGNVGIGADPVELLRRAAELLAPDGRVLVEAGTDGGRAAATHARLEHDGGAGPWFAWCTVAAADLPGHAIDAGLVLHDRWTVGRREFAELRRGP